jgi:hypothetical protein
VPYLSTPVIFHSLTLIDSFKRATGRTLLPPGLSISDAPRALFEAPFVVVSHGTESDPIFNYGNAAALALWGLSFEEFTSLPSRKSAPVDDSPDAAAIQAQRAAALASAGGSGVVDGGYSGVRVSAGGRRFSIENASLWGVCTPKGEGLEGVQGASLGQAATFATVTWLDGPPAEGGVSGGAGGAPGERWRFAPGGALVPDVPDDVAGGAPGAAVAGPPAAASVPAADVAAARAAADAQGAVVRALKAAGLGNDDEDVLAAVALLKQLKSAATQLEQAAAAAQ